MRRVIASGEGVTVVTNLPASAPPVNVMLASNSELSGKFFVLAKYIAERGSLNE